MKFRNQFRFLNRKKGWKFKLLYSLKCSGGQEEATWNSIEWEWIKINSSANLAAASKYSGWSIPVGIMQLNSRPQIKLKQWKESFPFSFYFCYVTVSYWKKRKIEEKTIRRVNNKIVALAWYRHRSAKIGTKKLSRVVTRFVLQYEITMIFEKIKLKLYMIQYSTLYSK